MKLDRDWKAPAGCKEPMRTFVELCAEFGVTQGQLHAAMLHSKTPVPKGFNPRGQDERRATHYPYRQMQRWWAAEKALREGATA